MSSIGFCLLRSFALYNFSICPFACVVCVREEHGVPRLALVEAQVSQIVVSDGSLCWQSLISQLILALLSPEAFGPLLSHLVSKRSFDRFSFSFLSFCVVGQAAIHNPACTSLV